MGNERLTFITNWSMIYLGQCFPPCPSHFSGQRFFVNPWIFWNLLCRLGWPQTYRDAPKCSPSPASWLVFFNSGTANFLGCSNYIQGWGRWLCGVLEDILTKYEEHPPPGFEGHKCQMFLTGRQFGLSSNSLIFFLSLNQHYSYIRQ